MCKSCESVGNTKCDCSTEFITGGTQPTDVQQLKHEIAAIADSLYKEFVEHKVYVSYVTAVVDRLRQLSCG